MSNKLQLVKDGSLSVQSLWDLRIAFDSIGEKGEVVVEVVSELHKLVQDNLNYDSFEVSAVRGFVDHLLKAKLEESHVDQLLRWSRRVLESEDAIKDIACVVAVKLKFKEHLSVCLHYMLGFSLSCWDHLIEDIVTHPHLNAAISVIETEFSNGSPEVRVRIYELGLPSEAIWSQFLSDMTRFEKQDPLVFATLAQAFHDACHRNPSGMSKILDKHDILNTIKRDVKPNDTVILGLLSRLPNNISRAESSDFINKVLEWFQTEKLSDHQCFELLASMNQSFSCPESLRQSLISHINCSAADERIAAILTSSLVASEWPLIQCRDTCRKVFQLATQPFVDYRLASHRFFWNIATANIELLFNCLPMFTQYLLNSSTEHELSGWQSKWSLLRHIAELSNSKEIKTVYERGFSAYVAGRTKQFNDCTPNVADQSV